LVELPWQRSSRCRLKEWCWTNSWHTKKWCERIRVAIKCNIPISRRLLPCMPPIAFCCSLTQTSPPSLCQTQHARCLITPNIH
jgi:hypothetical protein